MAIIKYFGGGHLFARGSSDKVQLLNQHRRVAGLILEDLTRREMTQTEYATLLTKFSNKVLAKSPNFSNGRDKLRFSNNDVSKLKDVARSGKGLGGKKLELIYLYALDAGICRYADIALDRGNVEIRKLAFDMISILRLKTPLSKFDDFGGSWIQRGSLSIFSYEPDLHLVVVADTLVPQPPLNQYDLETVRFFLCSATEDGKEPKRLKGFGVIDDVEEKTGLFVMMDPNLGAVSTFRYNFDTGAATSGDVVQARPTNLQRLDVHEKNLYTEQMTDEGVESLKAKDVLRTRRIAVDDDESHNVLDSILKNAKPIPEPAGVSSPGRDLWYAVFKGELDGATELIAAGADVNFKSHYQDWTPLHAACDGYLLDEIFELMKTGQCNLFAKSSEDRIAFEYLPGPGSETLGFVMRLTEEYYPKQYKKLAKRLGHKSSDAFVVRVKRALRRPSPSN